MAGRFHKGLVGLLTAAVMACALVPAGTAEAAVTSAGVKGAIERAIAYLRQAQHPDGSWPDNGHRGGCTALAVLGLLHAGLPANDPTVSRGLTALCSIPNEATYVVSLKAQALAVANDPKYIHDLKAATDWLAETQCPTGMWGYGNRGGKAAVAMGRGDNSNTQFALLGLHEAAKVGMKVPEAVWQNARKHFVADQAPDGGWGYTNERNSYGSMTAAGVASLYIVGQRLDVGGAKVFLNGAYPGCGFYRQNVVLAAGLKWLADNFSVNENPGKGRTWLHYYLYGLERVGMVSGMRNFGRHDWYREGAELLVDSQSPTGAWGGGGVYDTVFGLLFLSKGNRPVLVQKLKWKGLREPSWNRNIHDLENLTAFIDDKFGKRVTWQTTTLELPIQELRVGPVLYITGHDFPVFAAEEKAKLREFVESGGTLLCEACCGAGAYGEGFKQFATETFPEYRLHALDKIHPVFKSFFDIDDTYDLQGIDVGCRTGVFFSPKALDCLWELQTIPKFSEQAFKLGTNICAYATGKELLQDKLDVVELPAHQKEAEVTEVPRGATRIARLIHDGDYKADVHAEVRLAEMLRDQAKVDVVAQGRYLKATDEKLFEYPVVLMIGHHSFTPSDEEVAALRTYLDHGGCLIAEACCGRLAFDKSFRQLVGRLYPATAMEPLAANHPIYTGQVGTQLGELHYRRVLADELKTRGTANPSLEAVTVKGRTLIIYSKYDWSCSLEGDNPYTCRGYIDADGRKLALNIFLYAISY